MRIFGADSFSGSETSLDAIEANYLTDSDLCLVKVNTVIYFYRLDADSGLPHSIPQVVAPKFTYLGPAVDPMKRWILCDVFTNVLYTNVLRTNFLLPQLSGGDISVYDGIMKITPAGMELDGQLNIKTENTAISGDYPPLVVDSKVLVENLNAEFINGIPSNRLVMNTFHKVGIPYSCTDMTVTFPTPLVNVEYSIMANISNNVDTDPSIYGITITNQTLSGFGVKFSGKIDSDNYKLNYLFVEDIIT